MTSLASTTVTSNTTTDNGYPLYFCNAAGGSFTLSLNSSDAEGTVYYIKRIDTNALSFLTINATSSNTIDGQSSVTLGILSTLTGSNRMQVVKGSSNWFIIGI